MRSLLSALVLVTTAAHAYEVKHDSTGATTAWKTPLHFVVDANLNGKLKTGNGAEAVEAAMATMRAAVPNVTIDSTKGVTHGVGYDFDHPSLSTSDVVVPEEWKWDANAVAITVVSVSRTTHEIIEADIAFNAAQTKFGVCSGDGAADSYDVQNAMTHELGHALGLAHNPNLATSLMYPHSTPGEVSKRALAQDDQDGLDFLYSAVVMPMSSPATQGCSATGTAPIALLGLAMMVLMRRRRAVAAFAAVVGALMIVAPAFASVGAVADSKWTVTSVKTLAPPAGPAILESEVTVMKDGVYRTVKMPGGRWGDVEQIVEGVSVPVEGALVDVGDAQAFAPSGH